MTPRTVASGLGPGARLADATSSLMNPDFERRLLELVDQALELPADARAAFSPQGLRGDSALEAPPRNSSCRAPGRRQTIASWWTLPRCSRIRSFGRWRRKKKRGSGRAAEASRRSPGRSIQVWPRKSAVAAMRSSISARDLQHSRDVAIESDSSGCRRSRSATPASCAKSKSPAQLRHPFVIPLIDSGETQGTLYLRHALRGRSRCATCSIVRGRAFAQVHPRRSP